MMQRLLPSLALALSLLASAACSDEPEMSRQSEDYDVVEEGSAPGVTGTLVPPNDRTGTPPLTDTNLDTTTSFSIVVAPTGTSGTTTGGLEGGSLAESLPGRGTASRRPGEAVAPARQPSPAPEPSPREPVRQSEPVPTPAPPEPQPRVTTPAPEPEPEPQRREPEPEPEREREPAPPSSTTATSTREPAEEPEPPPVEDPPAEETPPSTREEDSDPSS